MKTYILCCPTLGKELLHALKEFGSDAKVVFLPDQLHNDPNVLRSYVQEKINELVDAERIVVCPSGCGGGTNGLIATNCELVIPRTRDCLDILLSGTGVADINRPKHGIFVTDSWFAYMQRSSLALPRLEAKYGQEGAKEFLRKIYKGFEHFYIIDTGVYDVTKVAEGLQPLLEILHGTLDIVPGGYGILKKIAQNNFDGDFLTVPKGEQVPKDFYIVNTDL
ncbi:DUF1638 domain-containing protein [Phascolarctobacterium sp.]|uniref:DUF1638 domain-containing protein n=1 Tax=Phascolarctobacterium sp. TaxID=2049039 RepID=UPI00386377ED